MADDVAVEQLFMPTLVVRLEPNRRGAIEPEEIESALTESVSPGDALIVDTGAAEGRHFARACGPWLAEHRASLLAASLTRYDTGFETPTGIFVELFRAGIPILAGIQNLNQIEHERAFLIVLPLRIERVCTTPCRAVVVDGDRWEVQLLTKLLRPDLVVPNRVG
jgi:kynurenine formamidase